MNHFFVQQGNDNGLPLLITQCHKKVARLGKFML